MKLLSKPEELVLLAVLRLENEAYCVPIREQIIETTGKDWSFGSIYIPLNRLEEKGYITSSLGESTNERGGRAKRYYVLTDKGKEILKESRDLQNRMWDGIPESI